MKRTIFSGVVALAMAFTVSIATACPGDAKADAKSDGASLVKSSAKAPCSGAKTVATDGQSESTKAPCHGKSAKTVSDKSSPCGKNCAKDCDKPCCKDAKTVSFKAPCHGKSAKTVSAKTGPCGKNCDKDCCKDCGKDCDKPCCAKGTKTVSAKTPSGGTKAKSGNSPCHGKSGKTVSAKTSPCGKDCDKPCCAKGAKTVAAKAGKKGCCPKKGKTVADKGGCPIEAKTKAVLASMPAIEYRVGSEVIGCSKSAAAMAEKSGKPLEYVIGKENFNSEGEAKIRLASLLEEAATDMQSMQYVAGGKCGRCPMTAKGIAKSTGTKVAYRVGGVDFEKKEDAERVAKLVADALKSVAMTYKVDGKTFHCDKMAGAKCKKSGKKMTYVIGDQETGCATSAKLMQAQAKVRKIIETASSASFSL